MGRLLLVNIGEKKIIFLERKKIIILIVRSN